MQVNDPVVSVSLEDENTSKTSRSYYIWMIWGLGAAFFFSEYFARVAPSVMVPELMGAFHVNAMSLGTLSAIFYYAYVSMQMPVGSLVDRFGPHRLLTATAALCAFGCFLFASANTLPSAQLGRFLTGFGASFAFVGTLKLATIWFCPTRFGLLSGLTQALGMLGAAVGEGPLSTVVTSLGWRHTMWLIGFILLALAVLIGVVVRDKPGYQAQLQQDLRKDSSKVRFGESFKIVLRNSQSWVNAFYVGLMFAPTAAFAELWGVTYLVRNNEVTTHIAATAISFIFIGLAVGCPIAGWISDRIRRRKPIMILSAISSFLLILLALYMPHPSTFILFFVMFMYGLMNGGFSIAYAVAGEINPREVAGTSLGFSNMASVIVGACFQPLIGWFLDLQWDGKIINGIPAYSAEAFRHALIALPLCLVVSLVFAFLVKETHCRITEN